MSSPNIKLISQEFREEIQQARKSSNGDHQQGIAELERSNAKLDEMNDFLAKQLYEITKMKQQLNLKERIKTLYQKHHQNNNINSNNNNNNNINNNNSNSLSSRSSSVRIQKKEQPALSNVNNVHNNNKDTSRIKQKVQTTTNQVLLHFEEPTSNNNNTNNVIAQKQQQNNPIDNKQEIWSELELLILPTVPANESTQRKYKDPIPISDNSNFNNIQPYTEKWDDIRLRQISKCKLIQLPNEILIQIARFSYGKDVFHLAQCNTFLLRFFFNQTPRRVEFLSKFIVTELWSDKTFKPIAMKSPAIEYLKDEDESFKVVQEQFWKNLTCYYFPNLKMAKGLNNWIHVLRRRVMHLQIGNHFLPLYSHYPKKSMYGFSDYEFQFVENCEWIYKCPLSYYELAEQGNTDERFCTQCGKIVYRVTLPSEIESHAIQGHCIALERHQESVEMGFVGHW